MSPKVQLAMIVSVVLACASPGAWAFVRARTPAPHDKPMFWRALSVPYIQDSAGTPDVDGDSEVLAVRRAFQTWEAVPCAYLAFEDRGVTAGLRAEYVPGGVNQNVVTWIEGGWAGASSATAYTLVTFVASTGEILDADITLNGQHFQFSSEAGGVRGRIDVDAVVTHEVGHFLGLDHSPVPGATLGPLVQPGDVFQRDLSQDDIDGACAIYPLGQEPLLAPPVPGSGCAVAVSTLDGVSWSLGALLALSVFGAFRRRRRASRAEA